MPKPPISRRLRVSLVDKKAVVDRYILFCSTAHPVDENVALLIDPNDEMEDERTEKSIKLFLTYENKLWPPHEQLDLSNVFEWIKAYDRGEYLEWGGLNDITKPNCRSKLIIDHINELLRERHPTAAHWNRLVKSPSSPDQYGIVANCFIPEGTLLGFYEGTYFESMDPVKGTNIYKIGVTSILMQQSSFSRVLRVTIIGRPTQVIKTCVWKDCQTGKENSYKRYKTVHSKFANIKHGG
jgi:hypothetical protein